MAPSRCTPSTSIETQQFGLPWQQAAHLPTRQIRIDDDVLPDRDACRAADRSARRPRHLVAHHARIGEIGMLALENVEVGAADPDMADVDQRPALGRRPRRGLFAEYQLFPARRIGRF